MLAAEEPPLILWQNEHFSVRDKIAEFANSIDPDEVAHNEPPHPDLYWFPCSLVILNMM